MGKTRDLKIINDTKGTFYAKMSTIKDRNSMDLTEAEDTKQEYTEELYKEDDAVIVLHSICQQIWKTQQWPQDWKRSVFIPIPKKGNGKQSSNYCTNALISQASKIMLKIFQARLQQYMTQELPDVQAGFRKGRETRDQSSSICWIIKTAREFLKNIYFCFIDYAKAFDCVDHNKLWKILKELGIPDHLTCLLRNLYAGQAATVRTGHGTTDCFQIGKGIHQGCICHPAYLTSMQRTS